MASNELEETVGHHQTRMMASVQRLELEQLYRDNFQPEDYVAMYYHNLDGEVEFFLRNLHDFFDGRDDDVDTTPIATISMENTESGGGRGGGGGGGEGGEGGEGGDEKIRAQVAKRRILEIGSGPVPISMISASRWCEWIVCSDFLEQNRQKIKQWLKTNVPAPGRHQQDETWLPFFRYVAQLERVESEALLLDRVRRSVGAVVPCNVLLTDPLMDYKGTDGHSSYDVIISTLCLEFASLSTEEYSAAVGNVARLLRPSGHFIIQGALGNSHYWHNNHKFPSVPLNRTIVESSLVDAGCQIIDWKELVRCCPPQDKPADHSAVFYCLARKI